MTPFWWTDIDRSLESALVGFETALEFAERDLAGKPDLSAQTVRRSIESWINLQKITVSAAEHLNSCIRIAEARGRDALDSGFPVPDNTELRRRAAGAAERLRALAPEIRRRMLFLQSEIGGLQPRRQANRLYRSNTPSHIDVHV